MAESQSSSELDVISALLAMCDTEARHCLKKNDPCAICGSVEKLVAAFLQLVW